MMRFTSSCLVVVCLLLSACSKREGTNTEPEQPLFPKLNIVDGKYLINKEEHNAPFAIGGTAYIDYVENKLTRRNGGFLEIAGGGVYMTEIFDTVQYTSPSIITITSRNNMQGFTITPCKREITVENGLITKKITFDEVTNARDTDTMHYFYDAEKLLNRTEQYFRYNIITKEFFFDNNQNLQKISTIKKARDNGSIVYIREELFSGYDNKINPLKGQTLWQDFLYRSLSRNNFTRYELTSPTITEIKTWTLVYDNNGMVDFSH